MTDTLRHDQPGTSEAAWAGALDRLPGLDVPGRGDHVLVLAAHPDDETLGAGGLIAASLAAGADVEVVIATDGEASHPDSPTHSPDRLAALRRREGEAAASALGGPAVSWLGLPDGRLTGHLDTLSSAVAERLRPTTVLATPWVGDRHPDHEACALAGRRALADRPGVRLWQFPIWAWHWADPTDAPPGGDELHRLDLGAATGDRKRAAVDAYRSQHLPLSPAQGDGAILPAGVLQHFRRPFECFVVEPRHPAAEPRWFDRLYDEADDPWGLRDRFYEQRKRDLLVASLPRPRFRRAFEPGCSLGLITERLAERCDHVVAWDASPRPLAAAAARLAGRLVEIGTGVIPGEWPDGIFDLVVLSEIGYYCAPDELAERVRASLAPDGVVVACHWRHPAPDHPSTAVEVHDALAARLHRTVGHVEDDFLLDVFSLDPRSVARREGITP
ncbi:MAG: PIG-L family deacetylase [Jatrophihabitans sp.]|uniref:PIG-L family deacetylase n=1 Tax=Jatrophihabitans sp. TaxID=1932789 RepID=UPI003F7D9DD7